MIKANRLHLIVVVLIIAALACNLPANEPPSQDPNAAFTAAAQTIAVQLTNAALSQPAPTNTFLPTATQQPTNTVPAVTIAPPATVASATSASSCDNGLFVADISIPDNTIMTPGETFTKTWRIKNIGTCSWTTGYAVVYASGNQMSGPSAQALVSTVNPNQTVDISVNMIAPATNGTYTGYWKLRNASGVLFSSFYVQIKVSGGGGGSGGGPFKVTGVNYTLSAFNAPGFVHCPRVIAHITTNGPGTVTYTWTHSSGTTPSQTLTFSGAGTQSINYDWTLGSVWAGTTNWVGIYINDPNNEDFGHLTFTVACTSP